MKSGHMWGLIAIAIFTLLLVCVAYMDRIAIPRERKRVVQFLYRNSPRTYTGLEIARATGVSRTYIYHCLWSAHDMGMIQASVRPSGREAGQLEWKFQWQDPRT